MKDYRFDPFNNVSEAVNRTNEIYIIPSSSPYVIELDEVPLKASPSTLTMRLMTYLAAAISSSSATTIYVSHAYIATGSVITVDSEQMYVSSGGSTTLTVTRGYNSTTATTHDNGSFVFVESSMTEVSASPTTGQFWPDYSTSADGDTKWNTGQIAHNESDGGKLVAVNYQATGSVANEYSVQALKYLPEYYNFGDETNGNFISTANFTLTGEHCYKNFVLRAGHTLTAGASLTIIRCTGTAIIEGTITAAGKGSAAGSGNVGTGSAGSAAFGGGAGGYGGNYNSTSGGLGGPAYIRYPEMLVSNGATPAVAYQSMINFGCGGGGGGGAGYEGSGGYTYPGGAGGAGGGAVAIIARRIIFTGTINANGNNGSSGSSGSATGGGGGGGSVVLAAKTITNSGTITVTGGSGNQAGGAGWSKVLTL